MPQYTYKVRDKEGRIFSGVLTAEKKEDVFKKLSKEGYLVTEVKKAARKEKRSAEPEFFKTRIKRKDANYFIKGLGSLLSSGLTLRSALKILAEEGRTKAVRQITTEIDKKIEEGASLSQALSTYPAAFNEMIINMISVGEESGNQVKVLKQLGEYMERSERVKGSLTGAMIYPLVILFIATAAAFFISVFTVPKFAELYETVGSQLPGPTRLLIFIVDSSKRKWKYGLIMISGLIVSVKVFLKTPSGKILWDHAKIKIPGMGLLIRNIIVSRFIRVLATLIESGVLMVPALEITAKSVGNFFYTEVIRTIKNQVEYGENLSTSLKQYKCFPSIVAQMAKVGEEGGNLASMFHQLADSYDERINESLKHVSSMAEPFILAFVGLLIGFVALALYMPVFKSVGALKKGF
ncbi:type II secretion system F family protein [bacterium]|nr:type II secretion system F family protein [bacterium]